MRTALFAKKLLKGAFFSFKIVTCWFGRRLVLPLLIRLYHLVVKIRRSLRPAERRFILVATHRGILHGAIVAVALTTAGGNIYVQAQATTSAGEQSILYRYITGDDSAVEVSGFSVGEAQQYGFDAVNGSAQEGTDAVVGYTDESLDQGSDTMTELGALMPEAPATGTGVVHRTQNETYVVQSGDTLSDIANKFGISIATILWENNLTVHDFIQPGQKLTILPSSGITYKVKSGDTIAKIAAAYGVDPNEVKSWNNIVDDTALQKDKALFLPGGKVTPPPAPKPKPKTVASPLKVFTAPPDAKDDGSTDMVWPAGTHYISQPYGIWSRVDRGIHTGVDLAAASGTPIYAAEDGIVTHAGCGARGCGKGYGNYVDIDHGNGIATRYGHNSKLLVKVGDQVRRGQTVALMGSTGHSTGPHLHFEVRVKGKYVNPMPYIR